MTKLLSCAIGLLLLSCGVAEAKELNDWIWIDKGNGMIATCNDDMTRCWTPCEIKMKEAMKEADDFMQGRSGLAIYKDPDNGFGFIWKPHDDVKRRWDSVMKECVQ